jgi:hypothetical protein
MIDLTAKPSPDLLATFERLGKDLITTAEQAEAAADKARTDLEQMTADQHAEQSEVAVLEARLSEARESLRKRGERIEAAEKAVRDGQKAAKTYRADAACLAEVVARGRRQADPAVTRPDEPAVVRTDGASCRHCDATISETSPGRWVHVETGSVRCDPAAHDSAFGEPWPGSPVVWSDAVPPGGYVCAAPVPDGVPGVVTPAGERVCGEPVESEPCEVHGTYQRPLAEAEGSES